MPLLELPDQSGILWNCCCKRLLHSEWFFVWICACKHPCRIKHFAKYSILYLSAVFQQIQGLDWCAWCLSNASSPAYEEKLPSKQPSNQAKKNKPISGDFANTWRLKEHAKSLSTCGECSMSIHPSSLAAPRQPGATIELTCSRL